MRRRSVFTKIGDLDLSRVDHWRDIWIGWEKEKKNKAADTDEKPVKKYYSFIDERELAEAANKNDVVEWFHLDTARQRLLEIAGQYGASYPLHGVIGHPRHFGYGFLLTFLPVDSR